MMEIGLHGLGVTRSPRQARFAGSNTVEVIGFLQELSDRSFRLFVPNLMIFRLFKELQFRKTGPRAKLNPAYSCVSNITVEAMEFSHVALCIAKYV